MEGLLKWLRAYGAMGSAVAATIGLLAANWVIALSVIASFYVGLSTWGTEFVERPGVRVGVITFLVLLWAYVGITILVDRRRPRIVQSAQDYNYGLTLEAVAPLYDPNNPVNILQIGIVLKNYSPGPIRYVVEHFDVRIGSRALPKYQAGTLGSIMPRGGGRLSKGPPFSTADLKEFFGKEVKGTLEVIIRYGHPDRDPVRRLSLSFDLIMMFNEGGPLGFADNITAEKDEAI
jgi:hypothetical protein